MALCFWSLNTSIYHHWVCLCIFFLFMLFTYFCCVESDEHLFMEAIATPFLMSQPMEDSPYLYGYCSKHQCQYLGVVQFVGVIDEVNMGTFLNLFYVVLYI